MAKAVELSERQGIDGWSMRQLAGELDVVGSVLYHYFSSKDEVCDAVVDTVMRDIVMPDPTLEWKEWFTAVLQAARPVLIKYHGVTERLKTGRFTEIALPALDLAMEKLHRAGFGTLSPLAYSMIVNVAINTISARNMRALDRPGPHHDIREMMSRLDPMAQRSPGLRLMTHGLFEHFLDPEEGEAVSQTYYDLILASVLDGIENVVLPLADKASDEYACCQEQLEGPDTPPFSG